MVLEMLWIYSLYYVIGIDQREPTMNMHWLKWPPRKGRELLMYHQIHPLHIVGTQFMPLWHIVFERLKEMLYSRFFMLNTVCGHSVPYCSQNFTELRCDGANLIVELENKNLVTWLCLQKPLRCLTQRPFALVHSSYSRSNPGLSRGRCPSIFSSRMRFRRRCSKPLFSQNLRFPFHLIAQNMIIRLHITNLLV